MTTERRLGSSYVLEKPLGRGASGEVWSGRDDSGSRWAFKLLHPELARDQAIVRRFIQERDLLTSIHDPHVVSVHDLVAERETLAIVMELVDGSDLRSTLRRERTLAPGVVARWGAQIAGGLAAAHAGGIIHRDVKPENVLLDETVVPSVAKLTDFGIAKLMTESKARTMTLGTPHYMAPEVAEDHTPTPASDLYSLGVMLYEMCCGVTPFADWTGTVAVLRAHCADIPGRPPGIPDSLWVVIDKLLAKSPAQRDYAGGELALRLHRVADGLTGVPAATPLTTPPASRPMPADGTVISKTAPVLSGATARAPGRPHPAGPPIPPRTPASDLHPTQYPAGPPGYVVAGGGAWMSGGAGSSGPGYVGPWASPYPAAPPPQKSRRFGLAIGVSVAAVLVAATLGLMIGYLTRGANESVSSSASTSSPTQPSTPVRAAPPPVTQEAAPQQQPAQRAPQQQPAQPAPPPAPMADGDPAGPVPESGVYSGTGRQTALAAGARSREYPVEMSFSSTGSQINYASFPCSATLRPTGWDGDKRTYLESNLSGPCDKNGTWAIEVQSDSTLYGVYTPPSRRYTVEVQLTR